MAPTSAMLQGLNLVPTTTRDSSSSEEDPSTDLTNEPLSHDLTAQLDLWSNVHFASDEPLPIHDRDPSGLLADGVYSTKSSFSNKKAPIIDPALQPPPPPSPATSPSSFFNYESLLPGYSTQTGGGGADGFGIGAGSFFFGSGGGGGHSASSPASSSLDPSSLDLHRHFGHGPTLSSLNTSHLMNPSSSNSGMTPALGFGPTALATSGGKVSRSAAEVTAPAAKKARTGGAASSRAKSSAASPTSTSTKSRIAAASVPPRDDVDADDDIDSDAESSAAGHQGAGGKKDILTPVTASEDKRRRNTAASARFRLKKKEREQAMEKRAKELEGRVGELERECEALKRENGWLKGLVVGVTGGVPVPGTNGAPGMGTQDTYFPTAGMKRDRDESSA